MSISILINPKKRRLKSQKNRQIFPLLCDNLLDFYRVRVRLNAVLERERFALLIAHALKSAGCQQTLMADSGLEILRQASKGLPRQAGRILCTAMRLAVPKGLNHLPDELLQQAIGELQ